MLQAGQATMDWVTKVTPAKPKAELHNVFLFKEVRAKLMEEVKTKINNKINVNELMIITFVNSKPSI
jgi:hypothetical protein